MWSEAAKRLADYYEVVVTALDAAGYPVSIRQAAPRYGPATGEFAIQWPSGLAVTEGPATLLCHSHDEKLWNIRQLQIKGRLECRAGQWVFVSTDFRPPPASQLGIFMRLARDMHKSGKRYLDRRGLEKPTVNWEALNALRHRDPPKMG